MARMSILYHTDICIGQLLMYISFHINGIWFSIQTSEQIILLDSSIEPPDLSDPDRWEFSRPLRTGAHRE
jgi:hypothetical protein